jgi:peroxiredoxin
MALTLNQPAPLFTLPTLDGRPFALESLRGWVVVINFWSAECPWAELADQQIAGWAEGWGPEVRVVRIASNANESLELLQNTAAQRDLDIVVHDRDHRVADLYRAETTPHIYLIDQAGILRYRGAVDDVTFRKRTAERFYLDEAVQAVQAGKLPPSPDTPAYGCTIIRFSIE